jgi:xylulokinase
VKRSRAVLGIDLGTSQVKALVVGADGGILGRGRAGYPVGAPAEGRAETDPEDWWRATVAAVREALPDADVEVAGVGVDGQMHGVVLAGEEGAAVRPAILWLDRRASAEAGRYGELPAGLTAPLGNRSSAGMAGPLLCWLARHEPDALRRSRWALQPKDWVRLRLTGQAATDPTDASGTLLFDLAGGAWAWDLIAALGLPADRLPPIRDSAEVAGRLLPQPAGELGLAPGIPVATGAADTAAALYAAGLHATDGGEWALLTVGTGGQWIVAEREFRPAAGTNVFAAVGGGFYRLAAAQNVGVALDWVRGVLGGSWQELYDTAAWPWRAGTPVFLPYLARERWDPVAAGAWSGLTLQHQRGDLLRAALEGVAFLLRRRLDDLRAAGRHPDAALLGGGGASHPAWRQLLADVLGLPLHPADTSWLSAAGAAGVAAAAIGMRRGGDGRVRSGYKETEAVAPRQLNAASAGYERFTHKLTMA